MDGKPTNKKALWDGGNAVRSTISRMKVLDLLVFVTIAFLDL
jgi:hypothetical protein